MYRGNCPAGLRGKSPNLDVLLRAPDGMVGIESKLTEHLSRHQAKFNDFRREQGCFDEMPRLKTQPDIYTQLDAAQLIKHAFGLARTSSGRTVALLYLFWEPANPQDCAEFAEHRAEIEVFAARVAGSVPTFRAICYPALWRSWGEGTCVSEWLRRHLGNLQDRYLIRI